MKKLFISMAMVLITSFFANTASAFTVQIGKTSYYDNMDVAIKTIIKTRENDGPIINVGSLKINKGEGWSVHIADTDTIEYIDVQILDVSKYDPDIDNESPIIKEQRIDVNRLGSLVEKLYITFITNTKGGMNLYVK